ncbi:restriction endonuclease subunit S [Mycoplasmopsis caviae]|uniref:Restriction endonuclease subunit S n=1 Tax=Mycoplasmopsis caviae TaxID=55603 RepID=A0A3P8L7D2_9BACT|nr:restriction endonuclease subunit S [Mycoplasmopsis caviae]UUD35070.1 restriction endonuclease subunit S [Mycoplasmopsis caviae]VDR42105.1 restriction modification enzyme subunit S2B [Mycoplasmopsis caviae]
MKLKDVCSIKTGKSNSVDAVEDGLYPLFDRSENVKRSPKFIFDEESIIIPGEGKEFIPRYYNGKFDLHQRCYSLMNFNKNIVIPKYLYYFLIKNNGYFKRVAVGSTVPSLRLPLIQSIEIDVPDLSTQQYIIDIIGSIDDLIEKYREIIEKTNSFLLKNFLLMEEKNETILLNSIVSFKNGYSFKNSEISNSGSHKIITIKNVTENGFSTENTFFCTPSSNNYSSVLNVGDILLTMTGNIGRVGVVDENNCILNQRVLNLKTEYKTFVYCWFIMNEKLISNLGKGSVQQNLALNDLKHIRINYIHKQLEEFEGENSIFYEKMISIKRKINALCKAKKYFLHRFFAKKFMM